MKNNMPISESKNFKNYELRCKHCGRCEMDEDFMFRLEKVRHIYNKPIYITSAYRCPEYNNQISSTGLNGAHTTGKAVDIHVYGVKAWELLNLITLFEFKGIGVKQKGDMSKRFIHIDDSDSSLGPRVWSY